METHLETSSRIGLRASLRQQLAMGIVLLSALAGGGMVAGLALSSQDQQEGPTLRNGNAASLTITTEVVDGWPVSTGNERPSGTIVYDLDNDGQEEILVGVSQEFTDEGSGIRVYQHDGSLFPTWPNQLLDFTYATIPTVEDIDRDGEVEILAVLTRSDGTSESFLYAWEIDGSLVEGWPQELTNEYTSVVYAPPVIADIDGDGVMEVVARNTSDVFAWEADGSVMAGWPTQRDNNALKGLALSAVDLDGDGAAEIISSEALEPQSLVTVYEGDGSIRAGWPQQFPSLNTSPAAIGNIDADSEKEIVIGSTNGDVIAWNHDGSIVSGWPISESEGEYHWMSTSLADVTKDGVSEVFAGSGSGRIYAWTGNGQMLPGWPYNTSSSENNDNWVLKAPSFGNVIGDTVPEIFVGTKEARIYGLNADGTLVPGFPVKGVGGFYGEPALATITASPQFEMILTSGEAHLIEAWTFRFPTSIPGNMEEGPWPYFHHDNGRSGEYQPIES